MGLAFDKAPGFSEAYKAPGFNFDKRKAGLI